MMVFQSEGALVYVMVLFSLVICV